MTTVTKAEIIQALMGEFNLNRQEATDFVERFLECIVDALASGDTVKVSGFGKFVLLEKGRRPGRNPMTGEEKEISARRVVSFRPGKKLIAQMQLETEAEDLD